MSILQAFYNLQRNKIEYRVKEGGTQINKVGI